MLSSLSATTEAVVPVVYVKRHDTKAVKDNLIQTSLLDLQHRITAVDPDGVTTTTKAIIRDETNDKIDWAQYVAIPVLDSHKVWSCIGGQPLADSTLVGYGLQVCPFSTRRFAAGGRH